MAMAMEKQALQEARTARIKVMSDSPAHAPNTRLAGPVQPHATCRSQSYCRRRRSSTHMPLEVLCN